jgi:hypothetical protein
MSFGRQLLLRFTPWLIAPVFLIVRLAIAALTMFPLVVPGNAQFWVPDASESLARSWSRSRAPVTKQSR